MDEVGFGPRRELRLPARYRRALAVLGAAGLVAAASVTLAAKTTGADDAARGSHHARSSPAPIACPPVQPTWPDMAGLPASKRPGTLRVIIAAQFSGECRG
jgi:hypothetical protein